MDEKKENQNNNNNEPLKEDIDNLDENLKIDNEEIKQNLLIKDQKENTESNNNINENKSVDNHIENENKVEEKKMNLDENQKEEIKSEKLEDKENSNNKNIDNLTSSQTNSENNNTGNMDTNANQNKNEIIDNNSNNENQQSNENTKEENKDKLTPDEFQKLYIKLHIIVVENKKLDKFKQQIIEMLESSTEFLINGDKNDPKIFELFSSLNFIHDLIVLMSRKQKEVNIEIIKFFSVLMTNLSDKHIFYFLFNCDFINQHIYDDNEPIEGDYLYYYISFIKSLILKINTKTIGFFYHAQTYSFPLLCNCLKFYNHPDSMIANTARNIFLVILKMNHPPCIEYMCTLPFITYFIFLACRLRDEIKTLYRKIKRNKEEDCKILYEEIINDIMYIQDIFSIGIEKINYILINCIFHFLILPIICNSIIYSSDLEGSMSGSFSARTDSFVVNNNTKNNINNPLLKNCISSELAIYILNLFLRYIKNETFLNLLISLFFLPKIHIKIMDKLKNQTKDLENYQGDYNSKTKKKIDFEKYVTQNFCQQFIIAQVNNPYKTFSDFKKIEKKLKEKLQDYNIAYNLSQPVPFGFIMELMNGIFWSREIRECREYHEIVSESTGMQCGLTYRLDRKCFIYLMQKNLKYIKNDYTFEKSSTKFIDNEIYSSFINSYKDCNDLFLVLSNFLFHQILNNELISKELLAYVKLLNPKEINKNIINNVEEEGSSALQVGTLIESKEKKEKFRFNEPITFSNLYKVMYKKDFTLKEFNFYNKEILSKSFHNGQIEYNSKLFGDVISYINRDYILKPESYLFIFKIINDLITYEENNGKKYLTLRSIHKTIIKNAFVKNIDQIINIINEGEISNDDLKMVYVFLWGNNQKLNVFDDFDKIIKNILKDCLFFISKENEEKKDTNFTSGIDVFSSLLINNVDLKIRTYFVKGITQIYFGLFEIEENNIKYTELNEGNIGDVKNIVIENFTKLTQIENK